MDDVRTYVSVALDDVLKFTVLRGTQEVILYITPEITTSQNLIGETVNIGRIGIIADIVKFETLPLGAAFFAGMREFDKQMGTIFAAFRQILTGKRDVTDLGGQLK